MRRATAAQDARRAAAALERAETASHALHADALVERLFGKPALLVAALAADDGAALRALAAAAEAATAAAAAGAEAVLCARLAVGVLVPLVLLAGAFTVHDEAGAPCRLPPATLEAFVRAAAAALAASARLLEDVRLRKAGPVRCAIASRA